MINPRAWLAVGVLLAGALLLACGGDGDDGDGDDNGDGGAQPTATESAAGEDETPPGDGNGADGGDASSDLSALAGEWATKEAKISYDFTSSSAGTESAGAFTLYWKPPDSWRLDMTIDGEAITLIATGGSTYYCSESGGEGTCIQAPASQIPVPFLSSFVDPDAYESFIAGSFAGLDIDRSERTIAGQDAQCYSASGVVAGEEGQSEFCFSSDGVPLRISGGGGGSEFTMEATDASDSVSDTDFELPYEILEIPVP